MKQYLYYVGSGSRDFLYFSFFIIYLFFRNTTYQNCGKMLFHEQSSEHQGGNQGKMFSSRDFFVLIAPLRQICLLPVSRIQHRQIQKNQCVITIGGSLLQIKEVLTKWRLGPRKFYELHTVVFDLSKIFNLSKISLVLK